MATKTYLISLALLGQRLCGYIRRYHEFIADFLDDDQMAVVDAALVACEALDVVLKAVNPPPT